MSLTTGSGKDVILERLRDAARNPLLAADRASTLERPEAPRSAGAEHLERWRTELSALNGRIYGPLPAAAAPAQVVEIARTLGAERVLAWDDAACPVPGAAAALAAAGIAVVQPTATQCDLGSRRDFERIPLGVSGALAGLADTGSIIVASGGGRPRQASLLPPRYIAVLRVADIHPDLPTWIAHEGGALMPQTANLLAITGPSRTADIELQLVIGVHGPGELHVVLVDG